MPPAIIGPLQKIDGSWELMRPTWGQGWNGQVHKRATRLVVDDFGDAVAYQRRCSFCGRWLPLTFGWFNANRRKPMGMNSVCLPCGAAWLTAKRRQDPQARRDYDRAGYQRRMQDPEYRARKLEQSRRAKERKRQQDPEAYAEAVRAAGRRYTKKLVQDPERYLRRLEVVRMNYRLRREVAEGRHVDESRSLPSMTRKAPERLTHRMSLPSSPLAAVIRRELQRRGEDATLEDLAAEMGISVRAVSRWESGEPASVLSVHSVLTHLGLNWWDVYDMEDARVREVLEGEAA